MGKSMLESEDGHEVKNVYLLVKYRIYSSISDSFYKEANVGNGHEMAQLERNSHPNGKRLN